MVPAVPRQSSEGRSIAPQVRGKAADHRTDPISPKIIAGVKGQALLLVFLAGFCSCLGNLALKQSRSFAPGSGDFLVSLINPYFISGLFFYGINVILFAKALDAIPVSIAYPILAGSGFALLTIAASILFSEHLSALQMLGLSLILIGIVFLAQDFG